MYHILLLRSTIRIAILYVYNICLKNISRFWITTSQCSQSKVNDAVAKPVLKNEVTLNLMSSYTQYENVYGTLEQI